MDEAVFAGVASRRDRRVGVPRLGGEGAGLFGRGWGLLLGAFRGKHNYHMILKICY